MLVYHSGEVMRSMPVLPQWSVRIPIEHAAVGTARDTTDRTSGVCDAKEGIEPFLRLGSVNPRRYPTRGPSHPDSSHGCVVRTPGAAR